MPNKKIKAQQSANSKKLDEDGQALIRQRNFPKTTVAIGGRYQSDREIERRKRQIMRGQLTASNGLVVSRPDGG